jgi:hypothetical protein
MQIPRVLVLEINSEILYTEGERVIINDSVLPNIKKSNAYYVYIVNRSNLMRLWHICKYSVRPNQIELELGNSYIFTTMPDIPDNPNPPGAYCYLSVTRFGLLQICPGVLVPLPDELESINPWGITSTDAGRAF